MSSASGPGRVVNVSEIHQLNAAVTYDIAGGVMNANQTISATGPNAQLGPRAPSERATGSAIAPASRANMRAPPPKRIFSLRRRATGVAIASAANTASGV